MDLLDRAVVTRDDPGADDAGERQQQLLRALDGEYDTRDRRALAALGCIGRK
jgi:hypothetical protein